jgi:proton-dependent oligopeptide transporter, POT family
MAEQNDTSFYGHPRGLATLFFTEMWERFSYYGMRALLILFMTATVDNGGLGFDTRLAGVIYGIYTALVYMTNLPGGWIADRFLGPRRAVFIGGVIIMCGHILLMFNGLPFFYSGLLMVIIGTGLLKPNVSTMVGDLYTREDKRRDGGFSIFYMGINIGAFIAPLICGYLGQKVNWHFGFGAAAVGMFFGLLQYKMTEKYLGDIGLPSRQAQDVAAIASAKSQLWKGLGIFAAVVLGVLSLIALNVVTVNSKSLSIFFGCLYVILVLGYFGSLFSQKGWTQEERGRLKVIVVLFVAAALFWASYEQVGSTLSLFADRFTDNSFLGRAFPSSWWQSVHALVIIAFAPVFAWLWVYLAKRNREPSIPLKFSYGLLFAGFSFLVLVPAALFLNSNVGSKVGPQWLLTVFFLQTLGELCLSPVGLSSMTKLAPARIVGQMMGVWFLAASVGNFVGGQVSSLFESVPLAQIFFTVFAFASSMGLLLFLARKKLTGLIRGDS